MKHQKNEALEIIAINEKTGERFSKERIEELISIRTGYKLQLQTRKKQVKS